MSKQLESPASLPVAPPPDLAPPKKKQPYPFWLGGASGAQQLGPSNLLISRFWAAGVAATIAASITQYVTRPPLSRCASSPHPSHSPLDLTKVRMQAVGDKRMIASIRKTVHTAGVRGLFDGITGTWLRQMSYSLCRFWAYDESKKLLGAGECPVPCCVRRRCSVVCVACTGPQSPAWQLALAGSMGASRLRACSGSGFGTDTPCVPVLHSGRHCRARGEPRRCARTACACARAS